MFLVKRFLSEEVGSWWSGVDEYIGAPWWKVVIAVLVACPVIEVLWTVDGLTLVFCVRPVVLEWI